MSLNTSPVASPGFLALEPQIQWLALFANMRAGCFIPRVFATGAAAPATRKQQAKHMQRIIRRRRAAISVESTAADKPRGKKAHQAQLRDRRYI
jgi:hypothetical protein